MNTFSLANELETRKNAVQVQKKASRNRGWLRTQETN